MAVIVVVLFHARLALPGGFVGVDMFFVVSGYVIALLLRRELHRSGTIRFRSFYLRRIRRLLPGFALLLVSALLLSPLLGPAISGQVTRRTGAAGALFSSNFYLMRLPHGYFDLNTEANPLLHIWSLSAEEQFYFIFPLLMFIGWRYARRWKHGTQLVLAAVALASFALNLFLMSSLSPLEAGLSRQAAFFSSPSRAWGFLAGALLAHVTWRLGRAAASAVGLGGAVLLGFSVLALDRTTSFPGLAALLPVIGTLLVLLAGTAADTDDPTARALSWGPLVWFGDISYSLYLWHWPLIVFAMALFPQSRLAGPLAAAISVLPAWISFRWIETPFRFHLLARPVATVGLGAACIALPLGAAATSLVIERRLPVQVRTFLDALGPHNYQARPCDDAQGPSSPADCTWQVPDELPSKGNVVLIGDSNAGHYSEAFITAAQGLGMSATVQTRSSCPFVDLYLQNGDGDADTQCRDFYTSRLDWLLSVRPNLVVIAGASDSIIQSAPKLGRSTNGPWIADQSAKQDLWTSALTSTIKRLSTAAIPTIVVNPVPRFPGWPDPDLCAPFRIIVNQEGCGSKVKRSTALAYGRRAIEAERNAASSVPGTQVFDPWPTLCPSRMEFCRTNNGKEWLFRNWNHLTTNGSSRLATPLEKAMSSAARS